MKVNVFFELLPLRSVNMIIAFLPRRFLTSSKFRDTSSFIFDVGGSLISTSFSTTSLIRRKLLKLNNLKEHIVFSKLDGLEMERLISDLKKSGLDSDGGVANDFNIFRFVFS